MSTRSFGVKEINIIGPSVGTPTIESPGNLNLQAVTVAISTDVSIGGKVVSNVVLSNSYSVGIGTTVLTEKLNVSGNANISGIVSATSFVGSGVGLTGLLTNQSSGINTDAYQYLLVTPQTSGIISSFSSSYNYITFNPAAKYLGIGTNNPAAGLDVNGTGRFIGTVTAPSFQGTATTATNLANAANITTGTISADRLSGTYNITVNGNVTGTVAAATTATYLSNATGILTGTISTDRLTGSYPISITGTATTANNVSSTININTSGIVTATGGFVGNVTGIASTATQLQNTRYFSVSGDVSTGSSVAFNGTQNVGLAVTLALSGVSSGTYGSTTSIPSITVNNKGIITGVTTSGITVGDGTLDLKTSGTGLSGTASFTANQATGTAVTFTVSSNATSANTASAIVSRDAGGNFYAGIITATTFSGTATTATTLTGNANVNTSGIITATTFSTGISTQNIGFTTGIISGPNTIYINPYQIGISTGTVRILGNLTVDGTTYTTSQQIIQSSAKTVGVAVSETSNIVLDGAGITIGSTSIQKTLFWNYGSSSLKSSENFNLANGKVYQINDNTVLSSTTLANSVTTAAGLTTVGTLQQLVVSNNTSTDAVRITQTGSGNALVVEDETNPDQTHFVVSPTGSVGIGTTNPTQKLHISGGDVLIDRGNSTNTLERKLTIGGARSVNAGPFASLNFSNYDDTNSLVEYDAVRLVARQSPSMNDGGELLIYTTGAGSTIAEERVRITDAGNVGIGLTTPQSTLHVLNPDITKDTVIQIHNDPYQTLDGVGSTTYRPKSVIAFSENLITDNLAYSVIWYGNRPDANNFYNNDNSTIIGNIRRSTNTREGGVWFAVGDGSDINGGFINLNSTDGSEYAKLSIQAGLSAQGNFGIGTTDPGEKLQVDGNIRVGISTTSNYIAFRGTYNDGVNASGGDEDIITAKWRRYTHTYIGERIYDYSGNGQRSELLLFKGNDFSGTVSGPDRIRLAAGEIRFDTIGIATAGTFEQVGVSTFITNKMILTGDGNLGIGTTNPLVQLHISGVSTTNASLKIGSFELQSYSLNNSFFGVNGYWNGSSWTYRDTGYSSFIQIINGNINLRTVGFPTSDIAGAGTTSSQIFTRLRVGRNGTIGINRGDKDNTNSHLLLDIRRSDNYDSYDGSNPNPFLVGITTNGNVGIGTTDPGEKLQVDGNIRVGISTTSNYIAFRGTYNDGVNYSGEDQNSISKKYTTTFIGERIYDYSGMGERSELLLFKGNDSFDNVFSSVGPDRIRLAAGEIRFDTIGIATAGTFEQVGVSTFITNKMILTGDGNLGIGTTNPTTKLVVTQAATANTCARFETGASTGVNIRFSDSTTTNQVGVGAIGNDFIITMATGGERLRATSAGLVGIGTTNPTSKLHVVGDAYITGVTTSTDFNSTSDINLKTNIHQIEDSLSKVIQIRGVTFNWKDTNRSSAGVIAQEVEKVLPELVNGEENKTVNYNGVIGALVEAVKELKAENDVLREIIDEVYKKVFG